MPQWRWGLQMEQKVFSTGIAPCLQAEHLGAKEDRDGLLRTVETAGTTMPAFVGIFDDRNFLFLIEMDHI